MPIVAGSGQRVQAGAVIHVDEVQAHRPVANADFTGTGLAHIHVDDLQLFGAAGLGDLYGSGHDVSS